jgi:hypothetical protein
MFNNAYTKEANEALASGIPEDELFTPVLKATGERTVMRISAVERNSITRGPGYKGIVRDQLTGKHYRAYGRPCSLPNCFCDVEVEESV